MPSKDLTQTLRLLLVSQLVAIVAIVTDATMRVKAPDHAFSSADLLAAATAVAVLVSYGVGATGLWNKKNWGRLAFSAYALIGLLPFVNDPADETKLSLCLNTLETLFTGVIIGLVYFAMRDAFKDTSKSLATQEVFS